MTTKIPASQPVAHQPLYNQYYAGGVKYKPHPNPPQQTYNVDQASANNSNNSSSSPSSSVSPPSPHARYLASNPSQHHQLRTKPQQAPLYIPAVLRPTENPLRSSPPGSGRGSLERPGSIIGTPATERGYEGAGFDSPSAVGRVITEDWNDESLCRVTGPPTKDHWKPDPSSPKCTSPACTTSFSIVSRRHHCRRCGNLFCASHSSGRVPLDQHARFHPDGTVLRACDACCRDYQQWLMMRAGNGTAGTSQNAVGVDGVGSAGMNVPGKRPQGLSKMVGSLAQSIPRDWNWSTF